MSGWKGLRPLPPFDWWRTPFEDERISANAGEIIIVSTPNGTDNFWYKQLNKGKQPMAKFQVTRTANVNQVLYVMAGSLQEAQDLANSYDDAHWAANNPATDYILTAIDTSTDPTQEADA